MPSGGSYKENMAKKRDERLKKRLDRKNGEEGQVIFNQAKTKTGTVLFVQKEG